MQPPAEHQPAGLHDKKSAREMLSIGHANSTFYGKPNLEASVA
jgi:hypothetical protein